MGSQLNLTPAAIETALASPIANQYNLRQTATRLANIQQGNVDTVIVAQCGDSFTGLRTKWFLGGASQPPGFSLLQNIVGRDSGSGHGVNFTGGAGLTNAGTNSAYWAKGQYYSLPSASTIKLGNSDSPPRANEFAVYAIRDSGLGALTVDLMAEDYGSSYAQVSLATAGAIGATKLGFFIADLSVSAAEGNTFTLTYSGQTTTVITYSSTAATTISRITSALSALTVGGTALSGLVTVTSPGGSTFRVIVESDGGGTVPSGPRLAFTPGAGAPTATLSTVRCWLKVTSVSGTCALVPQAVLVDRVNSGVAVFQHSFGGTQMSAVIGVNQSVFNAVWGDISPSLITLDQYAGQCDSEATYQAYVTAWKTACPGADGLHIGFAPTVATSDEITQARNAFAQPICKAAGWLWFDTWKLTPGIASFSALGTLWIGDGIHHGEGFNQYIAGHLISALGFNEEPGYPLTQDIRTSSIFQGGGAGIKLSKSRDDSPALQILAEPQYGYDAIFRLLNYNRYFELQLPGGEAFARLSANDDVGRSFLPSPVRIGSDTGPQIISGSGSPEGAKTAPIGSTYSRTDGGAGTSFYVKESGTGNTGWVAK